MEYTLQKKERGIKLLIHKNMGLPFTFGKPFKTKKNGKEVTTRKITYLGGKKNYLEWCSGKIGYEELVKLDEDIEKRGGKIVDS